MLRFVACGVIVALSCPAQSPLGILNQTDTSFTSRGSASIPNTNPSFAFQRIDQEHYAGWGIDPMNPGMRSIQGMHYFIQDEVDTTPESYGLVVYGEDPMGPDFPDVSTNFGTAGPIPTPTVTSPTGGAIAWNITVTFTTPMLVPKGIDVFPALDLPQPMVGGPWPMDGLSVHALYYQMTTSGTYDEPGAGQIASQSGNGGYHVPGMIGPTYTVTNRMWKIEPLVPGAGGTAGTITNQTWAPLSNAAPGTSSMSSGLRPDAQNPPVNMGRADDVATRWFQTGTPDNTAVLFFLDVGNFGMEIPLNALVPGSTGAACLNITSAQLVGLGLTLNGEAFQTLSIPAAVRPFLAGITLMHQAAGFNAMTGGFDANGCTRQIF